MLHTMEIRHLYIFSEVDFLELTFDNFWELYTTIQRLSNS